MRFQQTIPRLSAKIPLALLDYLVIAQIRVKDWLDMALIPIFHPDWIRETKPDYVVILPWNLKDEVMQQLHYIRGFGGQFVVPIPKVAVD